MAIMFVKSSLHTSLHTARSFHSFAIGGIKGDPPKLFCFESRPHSEIVANLDTALFQSGEPQGPARPRRTAEKQNHSLRALPYSATIQFCAMTNFDAIVQQLKEERGRLDQAISALEDLSATNSTGRRNVSHRGRKTMSAAARRRMAKAQRARWSRVKSAAQHTPANARPKRRISAAGVARIRAAAKARWARVR